MEIGSEYNLRLESLNITKNNLINYLSPFSTLYLSSGRSALRMLYLSISDNDGYVLMPEYICDSVVKCFPKEKKILYKINKTLEKD